LVIHIVTNPQKKKGGEYDLKVEEVEADPTRSVLLLGLRGSPLGAVQGRIQASSQAIGNEFKIIGERRKKFFLEPEATLAWIREVETSSFIQVSLNFYNEKPSKNQLNVFSIFHIKLSL
jgi:hypothetical protein